MKLSQNSHYLSGIHGPPGPGTERSTQDFQIFDGPGRILDLMTEPLRPGPTGPLISATHNVRIETIKNLIWINPFPRASFVMMIVVVIVVVIVVIIWMARMAKIIRIGKPEN